MVTRLFALVLVALTLTGCGTVELDRDDAADVVEQAFAEVDVPVTSITVEERKFDGRWPGTAVVADVPVSFEVDAGRGAIVALDLGQSDILDRDQLETIAGYADNPADDAAQRRRWATVFALILVFLAVGYALARRARLREEAAEQAEPSA